MKSTTGKPKIVIVYCPGCGWLLRAAWMAQEILTTFHAEVREVSLAPGESGEFRILCDGDVLWDRRDDGGFPAVRDLKRRVRDRVAPERGLGHLDADAQD